ncbi:uncharacterized protein GGS25DRAFT_531760 [Hypoxylon fragiforme]|uniref:uncharacterized protein n=1 Tax=Hypoxylon fragiforme TaxID=63214 RepID=UPI0020C5B7A9|nr:uncharacterized protein GGS25DRAFT_531760 [Hypoxylon fragiforme]KAI2608753.1 hypothetical protein GGS25DRAFT_531760 [Hypoxylon fragiforme]
MAEDLICTDIILSLHPPDVAQILSRNKKYLYRNDRLGFGSKRIWLYEASPIRGIRYCAEVSLGMTLDGIDNASLSEANKRELDLYRALEPGNSRPGYVYKIHKFYRLQKTISLDNMREKGWVIKVYPVPVYYASREMVSELEPGLILEFDDMATGVQGSTAATLPTW